jgi:deoxyribose-phosphate aldolase
MDRRIARFIDHTLLKPEATAAGVERVIAEAREHGFASVCIPPVYVRAAAEGLRGTRVPPGTVIGFPLGYVHPEARLAESRLAVEDGARELDTVINLSWLKSGEDGRVLDDIAGWVREMRALEDGLVLKVILETALLTDEEKERGARLVVEAGADFVKTSTGFAQGGATVEDVRLLARAVEGRIGVKASGGIRDLAAALAMIDAGATRLGTSSGVAILAESLERSPILQNRRGGPPP